MKPAGGEGGSRVAMPGPSQSYTPVDSFPASLE